MLAQILPGLRELRAPLAAGYLWLLALWIALDPDPDTLVDEAGFVGSLARLADTAGPVATSAVVSFVAYLVGSISEGLWRLLPRQLYDTRRGGFWTDRPRLTSDQEDLILTAKWTAEQVSGKETGQEIQLSDAEAWGLRSGLLSWSSLLVDREEDRRKRDPVTPSDSALRSLGAYVESRLGEARERFRAAGSDPTTRVPELGLNDDMVTVGRGSSSRYRYGGIVISVMTELDLMRTRLLSSDAAVHAAVDRLRAESDLRFAIVPPMVGLAVVLAVESSLLWLLLLLPAGLLFRQGIRLRRESYDLVIDALVAGRVDTPTLERIDRTVNEALDQTPRMEDGGISTSQRATG